MPIHRLVHRRILDGGGTGSNDALCTRSIGCIAGDLGQLPGWTQYTASKHALEAFSDGLRYLRLHLELRKTRHVACRS